MFYLYVKTHNITKLKYLGFTSRNPHTYKGSGKYWRRHLKKHGDDISTNILFETDSYEELTQKGLYYSELYDVVNSDEWANLKPESGDSGLGWKHPPEVIEKIRTSSTGRTHSSSAKEKCRQSKLGKKQSIEHLQKLSTIRKGRVPHNKGKPSPFIGIPRTEKCKENIKKGIIEMCKISKTCPYCGKIGYGNTMHRWHFDNCKLK